MTTEAALALGALITFVVAAFFFWLAARDLRRRTKDIQVTLSHVLRVFHQQGWAKLPENEDGIPQPVDDDGTFQWISIGNATLVKTRPAPGLKNWWRRMQTRLRPQR